MSKTVLVTGATGRIGSLLCRELWKMGYEVRAFVLPGDPFVKRFEDVPCEIVQGDLVDQSSVEKAVRGCDIVAHMAAYMVPAKDMDENRYMDINVKGTWNVTRCAMRAGVKRMVYGSSDAIYSPFCHSFNPIVEDAPKRPHFLYPLTKNLCENIVFEAWRESNYEFEVTAVRFGTVMAQDEMLSFFFARGIKSVLAGAAQNRATNLYRGDNNKLVEDFERLNIPDDALCIPYSPDGRSWRMHLTHVSDTVQGVILAIQSDVSPGEAFNILAPEATTRSFAVKYLADKTGQKYYNAQVDTFWDFECSIEKAKKMLGYKPVFDTKKLIDDALEWRKKGVHTQHSLNSAEF